MFCSFCDFQINCVVMRGINDDEVCDFVALTEKKVTIFWIYSVMLNKPIKVQL